MKRAKIKDERWNCFSREEIADKEDTLDLGLIVDDKLQEAKSLGSPEDIIREAKDEVTIILSQLDFILKELK